MTKSFHFVWAVGLTVIVSLLFCNACAMPSASSRPAVAGKRSEAAKPTASKPKTTAAEKKKPIKVLRWNAPDAEAQWENNIQASTLLSLDARMKGVDETQAEGQLEAFGTRYMPNAYAQYQEVRAKALELGQMMEETFPYGKASDPTGGTLYEKANKNLAVAVAQTFRRRDELCFFLLFHQAGIFSENVLAKYDSRPISIRLEAETGDWPDDTPKADTVLPAQDATFATKYLPETQAGYQRLCGLFAEGAKQYAELRGTALALGAPRARWELAMLKTRLMGIQTALVRYKKYIAAQRLSHALEETTAGNLAALDQTNAVEIQKFEQEMGVKAYVIQAASHLFVTLSGGATMEMVWCPAGTFMMGRLNGYDSEKPLHQVTLTKGFWIGRTEVTQAQWLSVMGDNPSRFKGEDLPVETVSWNDAKKFCRKAGKGMQLPTEAQWEYACRAGSTGPYSGTGKLDEMGWNTDYYRDAHQTHPVGTKQPNAWGLYDMHGNVWEWCADWYGDYPDGAVTDPQGPTSGAMRVQRGGSWDNTDGYCTSSYRSCGGLTGADSRDGFRLVRTLSD